jgi:MFS family permease
MSHRPDRSAAPARPGVVLRVGTAQAALGFALTGLGACLVLLARDLDLPTSRLAGLSITFGAGLVVIAALGPMLLRAGVRPAFAGGTLTLAAGVALLAVAPTLALAVVAGLLVGVGGAALVLVTPALLAGPRAAADLARVTAASSTASVVAPATIGALDAAGAGGRLAVLLAVPPLLLLAATSRRLTPPPPPPVGSPAPDTPAPDAPAPDTPAPDAPAPAGAASLPTVAALRAAPPHSGARQAAALVPAHPVARPAVTATAGPLRSEVFRRWARMVLSVAVEFCFTFWAVARLHETGMSAASAAVLGTAFPVGMAAGRLAGPLLLSRLPMVPVSVAVTTAGAVLTAWADHPAAITAALTLAGAGIATLYPITLADLTATPRLTPAHAASLGALASGTAILTAPAALAALAGTIPLSSAFLITLPLLAALLLLRPRPA